MNETIGIILGWIAVFFLFFVFQGEPDLWDAWTEQRDFYITEKTGKTVIYDE